MKANLQNIALLFCSFSVFVVCLFLSFSFYVKANEIKTWPKATATVISSAVIMETRKRIVYCPKIEVNFEQGGNLRSSVLEISQEPCDLAKQSAEELAKTFSIGKVLEVFVNPSNPRNVRLSTYSVGEVFYLTVFAGLLMFGATIYISRQLIQSMAGVKHDD